MRCSGVAKPDEDTGKTLTSFKTHLKNGIKVKCIFNP
jgi:hypothetical protein